MTDRYGVKVKDTGRLWCDLEKKVLPKTSIGHTFRVPTELLEDDNFELSLPSSAPSPTNNLSGSGATKHVNTITDRGSGSTDGSQQPPATPVETHVAAAEQCIVRILHFLTQTQAMKDFVTSDLRHGLPNLPQNSKHTVQTLPSTAQSGKLPAAPDNCNQTRWCPEDTVPFSTPHAQPKERRSYEPSTSTAFVKCQRHPKCPKCAGHPGRCRTGRLTPRCKKTTNAIRGKTNSSYHKPHNDMKGSNWKLKSKVKSRPNQKPRKKTSAGPLPKESTYYPVPQVRKSAFLQPSMQMLFSLCTGRWRTFQLQPAA